MRAEENTIKYNVQSYAIVGEPGYELIVFTYGKNWYMAPLKKWVQETIERAIDVGLTIKPKAALQILANAKKKTPWLK